MSDKISTLPAASSLDGTEVFPAVQSGVTKKATAAQIVASAHSATSKATPVDADELPIVDSAASNVLKKLTWADLKASLTYRDFAAVSAIDSTISPLSAGISTCLILLGDSTGDGTTDWFYRLLSEKLAPALPSVHIRYYTWSDGTQDWDVPTTIQEASGQMYATMVDGANTYAFVANTNLVARSSADFELIVKAQMADWTPAAQRRLAWQNGGAGNRGWVLYVDTGGTLTFLWSPDGTATPTKTTAPHGFVDGQTYTIRVRFDVDDGAGGYSLQIAKSSDDGANWTSLLSTGAGLGTTAIFNTTDNLWIGSPNGALASFDGKIYSVWLRDGIAGPIRSPISIQAWRASDSNSAAANSFGGSPTLYVFNGSVAGQGISYLSDSTRLPKITPISPVQTLLISTGHNDQAYAASQALASAIASWVTALRARLPGAPIVFLTQNPRDLSVTAGKLYGYEVNQIHKAIRQLATRNGCACIDTYAAFSKEINAGTAIGSLVADGVHPTTVGYTLWMNEVWRHFGL